MFTFNELARITGGEASGIKRGFEARGISTDTRSIRRGEIFIALKGERFDGAGFLKEAIEKAAAGAILPKEFSGGVDFPIIKVGDTRKALADIARAHRDRFRIPVIAVTGSNGKTTTKEMAAAILSKRYKVLKTQDNENNDIGVSKTLLRLKDEDVAVVELGTNYFGEIRYSAGISKPTIAAITNIGESHLEGLRDREGVLIEKLSLLESLPKKGIWVRNCDDEMLMKASETLRGNIYDTLSVISYGINYEKADFKAHNITHDPDGMSFDLKAPAVFTDKASKTSAFRLPVPGVHNVYNALSAIACCSHLIDVGTAREALAEFKGPHMRMEILNTGGLTIINDCYNCNPASLRCAAAALEEYPASGRRIAVVADMLELGKESARIHYEAGRLFCQHMTDYLITYGEASFGIARGAVDSGMDKEKTASFRDKGRLVDFLRSLVCDGDILMIKGSRGMKMEEIVDCFITCSTR